MLRDAVRKSTERELRNTCDRTSGQLEIVSARHVEIVVMERSEKIVLKALAIVLLVALAIGGGGYVITRIAMDGATSPRPTMPQLE